MRPLSRSLTIAVVIAAALSFCADAGAANVVVGPSLTSGEWLWEECEFTACTFVNDDLGGTGPNLASPVNGAVVRFSVLGGATPGTYRVSTMNTTESGAVFIFKKRSVPVTVVPSEGLETYATSLPISAGQTIGLSMSEGASVAFLEGVGRFSRWASEPPETGASLENSSHPEVVGFNAEIQPAPTITGLGATSGPPAGTTVTITGTDLEGVSSVKFGSAAATVTADSETQISAVAPAIPVLASVGANPTTEVVPVTVTTVAGTATSPQQFTYVIPPAPASKIQCVVPNLAGKKLAAAKKALANAHCALGKVKKLGGATPKSGKVSKQGSKAGAKLAEGSKVAVTLKPAKPAGKKHKK